MQTSKTARKTQINILLSGTKNQVLNPDLNYKPFPRNTSHPRHAGTDYDTCMRYWKCVTKENPDHIIIEIFGRVFMLFAQWSRSGLSVVYNAELPADMLDLFGLVPAKNCTPWINIQFSNIIQVGNGKNGWCHVCPTLIKILGR